MKEEAQHFDHQNQPEINGAKFNEYTLGANENFSSVLKGAFWGNLGL